MELLILIERRRLAGLRPNDGPGGDGVAGFARDHSVPVESGHLVERFRLGQTLQTQLTKPPGSLGRLESMSVQLAGIAGVSPPPVPEPATIAVFAADHGIARQGVSAYPAEVTRQMVANMGAGGAAVSVLARQHGLALTVVDAGVKLRGDVLLTYVVGELQGGVGTVAMVVMMLDRVAARIARVRTEDGDQPRENGAQQRQKDDCLHHWRVNPSSD